MKASYLASALAALALSLAGVAPGAAQTAETILVNGKILTLDERSSVVQALAIRDDKIVATGATDDIGKLAGAETRVIELGGRTVIPGLIDFSHPRHSCGSQVLHGGELDRRQVDR